MDLLLSRMTLFLPFSNHVATKSFDFISSIIYFLLGPQYLKNHIRSLSCNYWKKDHQYSLFNLHGDPSTLLANLDHDYCSIWLINHFKESMSSVIIAMIPTGSAANASTENFEIMTLRFLLEQRK